MDAVKPEFCAARASKDSAKFSAQTAACTASSSSTSSAIPSGESAGGRGPSSKWVPSGSHGTATRSSVGSMVKSDSKGWLNGAVLGGLGGVGLSGDEEGGGEGRDGGQTDDDVRQSKREQWEHELYEELERHRKEHRSARAGGGMAIYGIGQA